MVMRKSYTLGEGRVNASVIDHIVTLWLPGETPTELALEWCAHCKSTVFPDQAVRLPVRVFSRYSGVVCFDCLKTMHTLLNEPLPPPHIEFGDFKVVRHPSAPGVVLTSKHETGWRDPKLNIPYFLFEKGCFKHEKFNAGEYAEKMEREIEATNRAFDVVFAEIGVPASTKEEDEEEEEPTHWLPYIMTLAGEALDSWAHEVAGVERFLDETGDEEFDETDNELRERALWQAKQNGVRFFDG